MTEARAETSRMAPEKHERILRSALEVFIELGFERASVDAIAGRAGVSKATVYNHFKDKKALFAACLLAQADAFRSALEDVVKRTPTTEVEVALNALGEGVIRLMLSPVVAALHKVIAAEVGRFPELGCALYERSVTGCRNQLAPFFRHFGERGELAVPDPGTAAMQFLALCSSDLKVRVELGLQQRVSEEQIRGAVREAVATFLRAYRPRSRG
jgi:AcrR family transcriptional regulator